MDIISKVSNFCHHKLLKDKKVMEYLQNIRGLNLDSINKFEIGLFPQDLKELLKIADPKLLRENGILRNSSGSVFKTQNLIIPIKNVYNEYVAIAGRTLLTEEEREKYGIVKYINSIYKKSHNLFGLNFAKRSILKNNIVYVVEGYFDVIMPHQKGFENIVATCGTFLSVRHLSLLSRYTNNIVVIMDNEPAAQEKAKRIVEKNNYKGINLTFKNPLQNNKEKDIDEYLRNNSVKDFIDNLESNTYINIKPLW